MRRVKASDKRIINGRTDVNQLVPFSGSVATAGTGIPLDAPNINVGTEFLPFLLALSDYTELRAPSDGMVGNRSAQVGAYATTGAELISLVPARGLWIDANFKESQLGRMHPGSPATVTRIIFGVRC